MGCHGDSSPGGSSRPPRPRRRTRSSLTAHSTLTADTLAEAQAPPSHRIGPQVVGGGSCACDPYREKLLCNLRFKVLSHPLTQTFLAETLR